MAVRGCTAIQDPEGPFPVRTPNGAFRVPEGQGPRGAPECT